MMKEIKVWQAEGVAAKLQFQSTDGTVRGELTASPAERLVILNGRREGTFEARFEQGILTLYRNIG